jgi:hypothetical protein
MFVSEQRMGKSRRQEIVLAALYLFSQHDREKEVSWHEIAECIKELQKEFPLGYEFAEKFLSCYELSKDLDDLWLRKGYIKKWKYGQRGVPLFPTNFVALEPLGRGHAKRIMEALPPEMIEVLNKAIELAIEEYKKAWGPYAR